MTHAIIATNITVGGSHSVLIHLHTGGKTLPTCLNFAAVLTWANKKGCKLGESKAQSCNYTQIILMVKSHSQ
jgi:hypothetical protein